MEDSLNRIAPENAPYRHTMEGSDDMPAHVKSSLMGVSHTIPISNGQLVLGTWQGIYLCEHRNRSH
jgi:secondary thiamine-phosphate synthase enzyme